MPQVELGRAGGLAFYGSLHTVRHTLLMACTFGVHVLLMSYPIAKALVIGLSVLEPCEWGLAHV